jgi:hypothetical protein
MTNIYLLIYPDLKAFKIGKGNDVFIRADSIKKFWGEPNYLDSLSLKIDSMLVFKLEKSLHGLLEKFNMNFDMGDGKTEFFSFDALSYAIDYINIYIESNRLSSTLVKGIPIPNLQNVENTSKKNDYYFNQHRSKKDTLIDSLTYTIKNMETALRINNLLIQYRNRIDFDITCENKIYTLTLYKRIFLIEMLFCNLTIKHKGFAGNSLSHPLCESVNWLSHPLCDGVIDSKLCPSLKINLTHDGTSELVSFVMKELELSFKLLQRSRKR